MQWLGRRPQGVLLDAVDDAPVHEVEERPKRQDRILRTHGAVGVHGEVAQLVDGERAPPYPRLHAALEGLHNR